MQKNILIVDDEPDITKIIKFKLEDAGYRVYIANNGEEGLKKLKEKKIDLVLLDLVLPGENGFYIAREIKSMDEYKNTPIIIISCKKEYVDKHIALKNGILEYIEKPVDLDRLFFHIMKHLPIKTHKKRRFRRCLKKS